MKITRLLIPFVLMFVSASVVAEPAFMLEENFCYIMDGDGAFTGEIDGKLKVVHSENGHGGNINLKCHLKNVSNSTGKTVTWNFDNTGEPCGSFGLGESTLDWKIVVNANGNALLSCKFHFNE